MDVSGFQRGVTQIELQQALQRYAGMFIERVQPGFEPLLATRAPAQTHDPLRLYLRYASSVLDAATGQVPEINALDMLVFVTLTRTTMERYWLPQVYGEQARPLLIAMQGSEQILWAWAEEILKEDKRATLRALIERWLDEHPDQVAVESVRFAEFSAIAADVERNRAASGILSSVQSATQAADAMLVLSERALFLAQRAPFLLRMQARVGAREVLSDTLEHLDDVDALLQKSNALLERTERLRPVAERLVTLNTTFLHSLEEARKLAAELHPIVAAAEPLLRERSASDGATRTGIEALVSTTQALSDSARQTLAQATELVSVASPMRAQGERWLERSMRRLLLYAIGVGLLWSLFFCAGYYLARRLADSRARAQTDEAPP